MGKKQIGQIFQYFNVWGSWSSKEITPVEGIGGVQDIEVNSDSKVYVAASDGLWKWDGSDWTGLTGIPSNSITAVAIDKSTNPGILYAGTGEHGVFVSEDGGNTWAEFNDGLENLSINILALSDSEPKTIYAGTAGEGIWSREVIISTESYDVVKGIPLKFKLKQNYPNPFNLTTIISYELPNSSFVRLSIYNFIGRLVDTIVNEQKNAGSYTVRWNAENISSGIYFYRIDAGEFSCVKKCLVIK